jgi:cyclophilin family peptidyl-prolyl cis-trans isomerase
VAKRRQTLKCPVCKIEVKAGRLDAHLQKVHPGYDGQPRPKGKAAPRSMRPEMWLAVAVAVVVVVAGIGIYYLNLSKPEENGGNPVTPPTDNGVSPTQYVRLTVAQRGEIVIGLYGNETPNTVQNFMQLVSQNYFTGTIFHRIVAGFVVQGGGYLPDMNPKPVTVSPIKLEINSKLHNYKYTVAMARTSDPNSATTQFFINIADNHAILDPGGSSGADGYAVFGKVLRGTEVVDSIATATTETPAGGQEKSQPTQDAIPSLIITNCMVLSSLQG